MELEKFHSGDAFDAYEYFGAHTDEAGARFRLWAPRADSVCLMGDFSSWRELAMQKPAEGIWELYVPHARCGQMYKYVVYSAKGRAEHCDPYGFGMEMRPGSASVIQSVRAHDFGDKKWMSRRTKNFERPVNIYELHLGTWRKRGWQWYLYDEIADELISYLKAGGYTHVEFLPLTEHPFDGSWGYQSVGWFAPTSRYGSPAQLMRLVDRLHQAGIGAILDFVPLHFARDGFALKCLDGQPLYEYADKGRAKSEWGSLLFDHSRAEVRSFLKSSANYWLKEYHFDGLRMDAVSRLIFREGDWTKGENSDGLRFLRELNCGLQRLHPTAMLIAEDSTAMPGVTAAVEHGGLGFDYKWDLGWSYSTLKYLSMPPANRKSSGGLISASLDYSRSESFILPLSHDECSRHTGALASRLWGDREAQRKQARLLHFHMLCHPGKKLGFMGTEFPSFGSWRADRALDWNEADEGFLRFVSDMNSLYIKKKALFCNDRGQDSFQWLSCGSTNPCVFGYSRPMGKDTVLAFLNFSDKAAKIAPDIYGNVSMLINTDWDIYGGGTKKAARRRVMKTLPAYSAVLYICRD